MSTATLATALTRLHTEAASREGERHSDRQLLEAYAAANDQAAFAALVRRHGPMVLGVCRRVLQDVHHAEDAFQAVFLTLARKAALLRQGEALAGWLHGVSYRVALSARRDAARRRKHERRVAPRTNPPAWEIGWRELQTVLDEEVERLPSIYRAVFVLCCLDGLSKPEAARQLAVNENTVSSRLARARKQLQERLARRGISLSAVLTALAVSGTNRAALALRLVGPAVEAATRLGAGAPVTGLSARAFSLAEGVTPTMLPNKLKWATVLLLVLCTVGTGLGVFARLDTKLAAPPMSTKPIEEMVEYRGRVLDLDGKPIPRARVHLWDSNPCKLRARVRARTDSDGRYRFTVRKAEFARSATPDFPEPWKYTAVVARADGYGFGVPLLVGAEGRLPPIEATTIQLVKDNVPITGRILDLQAKGIPGVTVRVRGIQWPVEGKGWQEGHDLTPFLRALKTRKEGYYPQGEFLSGIRNQDHGLDLDDIYPPVRTDAAGRFRITGIGRERIADLLIEGPTIETKYVYALTRPCETIEVPAHINPRSGVRYPLYSHYGANFDHVAAPSKLIVGVVRDKDTGKPIPGALVTSYMLADLLVDERTPFRAVADEAGRYRITGMPRGKGNTLQAKALTGRSYVMATEVVGETPGLEPITVDFALKRGTQSPVEKDK
jgi:RNA polymerase sigma factor (sigma-70 family)